MHASVTRTSEWILRRRCSSCPRRPEKSLACIEPIKMLLWPQQRIKMFVQLKPFQEEHKSVVRLKRYIALCGVRRNYKKMLEGCHTIRSIVERLTKELEDLGLQGNPTIEKCKKIRKKREKAQEVAELDTSNIITGIVFSGTVCVRTTAHNSTLARAKEPRSSTYQRTVDSGSDSDQQKSHKGQRKTDWNNLQGIISDDGESD
uniref:HIRA interacting protein 3 n=1 Tax=Neogobius melanostomus TaxID=47308 RepID=A0A8C6U4F1_9GOBI